MTKEAYRIPAALLYLTALIFEILHDINLQLPQLILVHRLEGLQLTYVCHILCTSNISNCKISLQHMIITVIFCIRCRYNVFGNLLHENRVHHMSLQCTLNTRQHMQSTISPLRPPQCIGLISLSLQPIEEQTAY